MVSEYGPWYFCEICRRQCHYEFNTVFQKSCIVFCAKPKEVYPIKLISLRQISVSIVLKYINNSVSINKQDQGVDDCHTFFFFYRKYLNLLYRSIGAMIHVHQPLSPDGVHPQKSSSLRLLVLCLVRPDLFVIYYCLFIFSKDSFVSVAPLTNATRAFSTCWFVRPLQFVVRRKLNKSLACVSSTQLLSLSRWKLSE